MRKSIVYTFVACLLIAAMPYSVTADASEDIPTNAAATGVHDSLVAALTHANLVATLQGDGPFTVFAPTDQAFIDAGIDLSTFDTPEENETLADILLYHVLSGNVNASQVTDGLSVVMANGDKASFTVTNDSVMIGDATVTTADVEASNGIIHVIDKVLMPPP
ncbi:MAG: fasciclin domain-containing protein, partial [Candidatus Poseidoniaceae archaeon]